MLPLKAYLAVAALIAVSAFALGQLLPGAGAAFAAVATTAWTAFAARRGTRAGGRVR